MLQPPGIKLDVHLYQLSVLEMRKGSESMPATAPHHKQPAHTAVDFIFPPTPALHQRNPVCTHTALQSLTVKPALPRSHQNVDPRSYLMSESVYIGT